MLCVFLLYRGVPVQSMDSASEVPRWQSHCYVAGWLLVADHEREFGRLVSG